MAARIRKKKARTRNRMGEMIAGNGRPRSSARRRVDRVRRRLVESEVPAVDFVPVSSRGQDTWFSATGPGFESPYRYQLQNLQAVSAPHERVVHDLTRYGELAIDALAQLCWRLSTILALLGAHPADHTRGRVAPAAE